VQGRPSIPEELRAMRRISVRLYADDAAAFDALCEQLSLSESEVIRAALQLYACECAKKRRADAAK
jgi:metal-responsive CopG/Arc/MetJ family transcriptional regulator